MQARNQLRRKYIILPLALGALVLFVNPECQCVAGSSWRARQLQQTCDSSSFPALKSSTLESKVVGMEWVGAEDQYLFVVTLKNQLWRSKDGGSTFEDLTGRLSSAIKGEEAVRVVSVLPHKSDANRIVFVGAGVYMWLSQDYGETVTPVRNYGNFRGANAVLKRHPTQAEWVLALARRPGCSVGDGYEMQCPSDLLLSQSAFTDLKWVNLTENAAGQIAGFVDFDWAQQVCLKSSSCAALGIPEPSIFATMYEHPGDWDVAWDPDVHFVTSDNLFRTIKRKIACGNQFELIGREVYMARANSCPTDMSGRPVVVDPQGPPGITLHTSLDGGSTFRQACLPVALKQEGYELMETHDGIGTVIVVDYLLKSVAGARLTASAAYTSGPRHALFGLSLGNIYRQDVLSSASDFMRVDGVPGVFIANQMASRRPGDDAVSQLVDRPLVQTRITFNGGGSWQALRRPEKFRFARCDRCDGKGPDECHLHLHGASSWFFGSIQFPSVYSHPSAPGLLMASGNVGPEGVGLDDNNGQCTWLSRDGGATWSDVAEGTYIYEYADWGGVIVMAQHELTGPADEVRFSTDYGRCWRSVGLEAAMLIENIRIEPDGQRPKVLVHGKACMQTQHPKCSYTDSQRPAIVQGLIYALDIKALLGDKLPACRDSDFELWTVPSTEHTPRCLLGQQMLFTTRRQASQCLQGGDYARPPPANTTCACTPADVECDFGYMPDGGGSCRPLAAEKLPNCPDIVSGTYTVSASGKRLVHADTCSGVSAVIPDTDGQGRPNPGTPRPHQPGEPGSRAVSGLFVVLVLSAVLAGSVLAWYHFLATPAAKVQAEELAASARAAAVAVGGLAAHTLATGLRRAGGAARGGAASVGAGASVGSGVGAMLGSLMPRLRRTGSTRYDPIDEELNYYPMPGSADDPAAAAAAPATPAALLANGVHCGSAGAGAGSDDGGAGAPR